MVLYDQIGKTYDTTRRADPVIVSKLLHHLQCPPGSSILDIGCGSGNYTVALQNQDYTCTGLDVSDEMLSKARSKSASVTWLKGDAAALPFPSATFDGITCILATHHMNNLPNVFSEAFRVLKPSGHIVLFTATSEQMHGYWLWEYFPGIMERGCREMEVMGCQAQALQHAGFCDVDSSPFSVTNDLIDWFLHAGKYRPEIYLDASVRACISSFARPGFEDEVTEGVLRLQADIHSGRINTLIQKYENSKGDYLFIQGVKPLIRPCF